jgi:formamidopyrimidine-DNA glycosylase
LPELPEVESVRRRLRRALRGRRILGVEASNDPIVLGDLPAAALVAALRGRCIEDVRRKGKHLYFVLDQPPWPLFHFGMTGWFHIDREDRERRIHGRAKRRVPIPATGPRRFQRVAIDVEGGTRAVFTDPRRFGRIRLQRDPLNEPPLSLLGFDVLDELPPAASLRALLARRQAPIKAVLLDQALFAGVGNWIADEVLYQARIRPDRAAASLAPAEVAALRRAIVSVVRRAVAVDADSARFPRSWLFHHRWGRNADAVTRSGERIVHATIGGRTTAWVPARQR